VTALAGALRAGPARVKELAHGAAAPASQTAARRALELAKMNDGAYLAGLLDGMAAVRHESPDVRPVWTGPSSSVGGSRLTIAVVGDLIAEAEHEIVLVSYATYPPPTVTAALQGAATRGVAVTLLLERAQDKPGWKGMTEPFPDLDARHLCWPLSERPVGASLHAKVLVVDRRVALVGSANLTAFALERNLECGLLVRGGHVPRLLAEHLTRAEGLTRT
jgi:phosphatidylserine/phosphatidylglycerophosphate/cardiolipin synthase-like enzyme